MLLGLNKFNKIYRNKKINWNFNDKSNNWVVLVKWFSMIMSQVPGAHLASVQLMIWGSCGIVTLWCCKALRQVLGFWPSSMSQIHFEELSDLSVQVQQNNFIKTGYLKL